MSYEPECWAVIKKDEHRLHVAEMRMLRWIGGGGGKTRKDNVRNQIIQYDVNIPETEKIKLVWTYQEKRRRQPLKRNDGHGSTGEQKKGAA